MLPVTVFLKTINICERVGGYVSAGEELDEQGVVIVAGGSSPQPLPAL